MRGHTRACGSDRAYKSKVTGIQNERACRSERAYGSEQVTGHVNLMEIQTNKLSTFRRSMNGMNKPRCRPPSYSLSGCRLEVAT
eukprot:1158846-Pelagomonas_calceolata.AAC.10